MKKAQQRLAAGDSARAIAKTYKVHHNTVLKLLEA
jgi:hypothetical protein